MGDRITECENVCDDSQGQIYLTKINNTDDFPG